MMACSDYPFCIYCGEPITTLQLEGESVIYSCSNCRNSTSVRGGDEGLLSVSGSREGC